MRSGDNDDPIALFRPQGDQSEVDEVAAVLRSGWWGQGPVTADLERRFADFTGARHAVAVNSATAALHLALRLADVEGHEVITPSMTFVSTCHAVLYNRATPVFADIDAHTLNLDPADVERCITPRTRAIVPVHFGGLPADLEALHAIARRHGLVVIEDAAHATGAQYQGRPIGSLSPLTCFSFHPVKNLATGDGGMITLARDDWDARLRRLRWMGIDRDTWQRQGPAGQEQPAWQYDVTELGFKYHTNDINSAIARVQLQRLPAANARRRAIAGRYDQGLAGLDWLQRPAQQPGCVSAHHNHVIRLEGRDRLARWLGQHGVATGVHYKPCHLMSVYRPHTRHLPVTEREWLRVLSLPLHLGLSDDDVDRVIDLIRRYPA